jgi:hypothetical protein
MGGHNKLNLSGQRFGRLFVVDYSPEKKRESYYRCVCDCGNEKTVRGSSLTRGDSTSCGCWRVEQGRKVGLKSAVHKMLGTPTYETWRSMKRRCTNKNERAYKWYGAKGVTICEKWQTFEGFYADMGDRPEGKTLDRINPFGNYEPSNCRWADVATQIQNTRKNYAEAVCQ